MYPCLTCRVIVLLVFFFPPPPSLTTVHRQPGCGATEQPGGDSGRDAENTSEWNSNSIPVFSPAPNPCNQIIRIAN